MVSTKVLSPRNAVVFAAFFNFLAAFGFGVAVADTISNIVDLNIVTLTIIPYIVLGALTGAISWNIITWFFGLPTSSSHALIGGLAGAGISAAGLAAIKWSTVGQVALFMVLSPLIGLVCGFLFMAAILWITRKASKPAAEGHFKRLQLCSAAAYSFSHGTNDAQKTMGIIVPLLFSSGLLRCECKSQPPPGAVLGDHHLLHDHCLRDSCRRVADRAGPWDTRSPSSARCTALLRKLPGL